MAALREARSAGAHPVHRERGGLLIAREADDVLYTWAGPEIAVATTKAYSTQLAACYLLGLYFGVCWAPWTEGQYTAWWRSIEALPAKMEKDADRHERTSSAAAQVCERQRTLSSSAAAWTTPWRWRAA